MFGFILCVCVCVCVCACMSIFRNLITVHVKVTLISSITQYTLHIISIGLRAGIPSLNTLHAQNNCGNLFIAMCTIYSKLIE